MAQDFPGERRELVAVDRRQHPHGCPGRKGAFRRDRPPQLRHVLTDSKSLAALGMERNAKASSCAIEHAQELRQVRVDLAEIKLPNQFPMTGSPEQTSATEIAHGLAQVRWERGALVGRPSPRLLDFIR